VYNQLIKKIIKIKNMFIAIVFIAIGLAILLNTLGIISGGFWGFFWSILFLAIGVRLLTKKNVPPCCGWNFWQSKANGCDENCDEECNDNCGCGCGHNHNIEE
jgi:hypothetical protein